MKGKKRWRKVKKEWSRIDKILRKIEIVAKHYDYYRGDYQRICNLLEKLKKIQTEEAKEFVFGIMSSCAWSNMHNCSGCTADIEKYCTEDLAPCDWGV